MLNSNEANDPVKQPAAKKKMRKVFTPEEDKTLLYLVNSLGTKNWDIISSGFPNRSARQCRDRWKFYLCPLVNNGPWTEEEDRLLFRKYMEIGSKWAIICQNFGNRSINNVKNRWYSVIRRVRMNKLNENDEIAFLQCANVITQQQMSNKIGFERIKSFNGPDFFFNVENLLNDHSSEIQRSCSSLDDINKMSIDKPNPGIK